MPTRILIISGEVSGDQLGAKLGEQLKQRLPDSHLTAMGGSYLAGISDEFLLETAHEHVVGFFEAFRKKRFFKKVIKTLSNYLKTTQPNLAIIVDYAHVNTKIGTLLKQHNIPIITYITPNFWIWKDIKHAQKLIAYSDLILTIFKKEYDFYRALTDKVVYVGHPMSFDKKYDKNLPEISPNITTISLFPGSRKQEVNAYLTPMLDAVEAFSKDQKLNIICVFACEQVDRTIKHKLNDYKHLNIKHVQGDTNQVYKTSDIILTASGTATLECAFYRKPMIILGSLSTITYWIIKYILRIPITKIGLPNILSDASLVPELLQKDLTANNILSLLRDLDPQEKRRTISQNLNTLITQLNKDANQAETPSEAILKTYDKLNKEPS